MAAWVAHKTPSGGGRFAGVGVKLPQREDVCESGFAVDGMHELSRYGRSYADTDRTTGRFTFIGYFDAKADAISAWRRWLRTGELQ